MRNIAIIASGEGTNAENIIKYFSNRNTAKVSLVLSNNRQAMVLKRAEEHNVRTVFFERKEFYVTGKVLRYLILYKIDLVVLAGFLWLVPEDIVKLFSERIINIHPALLPDYGGKGMYGENVHKAVIANQDTESGITIHYVDKMYDNGDAIFQERCKVDPGDTPDLLAERVHALEYEHYPRVIEEVAVKLPDFLIESSE